MDGCWDCVCVPLHPVVISLQVGGGGVACEGGTRGTTRPSIYIRIHRSSVMLVEEFSTLDGPPFVCLRPVLSAHPIVPLSTHVAERQ